MKLNFLSLSLLGGIAFLAVFSGAAFISLQLVQSVGDYQEKLEVVSFVQESEPVLKLQDDSIRSLTSIAKQLGVDDSGYGKSSFADLLAARCTASEVRIVSLTPDVEGKAGSSTGSFVEVILEGKFGPLLSVLYNLEKLDKVGNISFLEFKRKEVAELNERRLRLFLTVHLELTPLFSPNTPK